MLKRSKMKGFYVQGIIYIQRLENLKFFENFLKSSEGKKNTYEACFETNCSLDLCMKNNDPF